MASERLLRIFQNYFLRKNPHPENRKIGVRNWRISRKEVGEAAVTLPPSPCFRAGKCPRSNARCPKNKTARVLWSSSASAALLNKSGPMAAD
jgi:hypothetical protein